MTKPVTPLYGIPYPAAANKIGGTSENVVQDLQDLAIGAENAVMVGSQQAVDRNIVEQDLIRGADLRAPRFSSDTDHQFMVTDENHYLTELCVDREHGKIPDWIMDRWAQRIASRIGHGSGAGFAKGDRYINSAGDLVPAFPITDHIVGWGSSSMEYGGPELAAAFPEATFHNEGKGGEWSSQIAARMGAIPALLTVTGGSIPASGPVTVTSTNMVTNQYLKPFTGALAGVPGTLSSTASTLTFTRTAPGSVVPVPAGTPFIPAVPEDYRQYVGFLWAGKNNLWTAGQASVVVADTRAMFEHFTPFVKRILVFNHFVHTSQGTGTTLHSQVQAVNTAYKAMYGDLCFDVNGYILSSQIWADTGINPTPTDLQQQADGVKPVSLSSDDGHLNSTAEVAVANRARAYASQLGYY